MEERARPDHDRNVFSRTALECLAVDRPGKRHRHAIPALGLRLLALILEGPILLADALNRSRHLVAADLRVQALELDRLEVGEFDRRHHFKRHRVGKIALAGDHAFQLVLVFRHLDLRIERKLEAMLRYDLGVRLANKFLDRFRHDGAAIEAAQMGDGDLAGPKTVEPNVVLELGETIGQTRFKIGGGYEHLELALKALGDSLRHLHVGLVYCKPCCWRFAAHIG